MSKPSWDDAPEWAQHLAMDSDGAWYWYEREPILGGAHWHEESFSGKVRHAKPVNTDWADTKEARP